MWIPRIGRALVVVAATLAFAGCVGVTNERPAAADPAAIPAPDPLVDLRNSFRLIYAETIRQHRQQTIARAPVVTQDLLNMTLIRGNGEKARFEMDKKTYFLMAHTSHPPLAVYAILARSDFGALTQEQGQALSDYRSKLDAAQQHVAALEINGSMKARVLRVLGATIVLIDKGQAAGGISQRDYLRYAKDIRPLIKDNLYVGAREQLEQFRARMTAWRQEFPAEDWHNLRVVVLGFHQPRDDYALKLFFQWLLREPDYEKRVVYAEFQDSFSGDKRAAAEELALTLATKVDFELEASKVIFGDERYLQSDVMGPPARRILKAWGQPPR